MYEYTIVIIYVQLFIQYNPSAPWPEVNTSLFRPLCREVLRLYPEPPQYTSYSDPKIDRDLPPNFFQTRCTVTVTEREPRPEHTTTLLRLRSETEKIDFQNSVLFIVSHIVAGLYLKNIIYYLSSFKPFNFLKKFILKSRQFPIVTFYRQLL